MTVDEKLRAPYGVLKIVCRAGSICINHLEGDLGTSGNVYAVKLPRRTERVGRGGVALLVAVGIILTAVLQELAWVQKKLVVEN